MERLKKFPVKLQLDAILYAYQGSALICMVHTMISYNNQTISEGLKEFYKHNSLNPEILECAINYCEENESITDWN